MKDRTLWIGVFAIIVFFVGFIAYQRLKPGAYDAFAQCLSDQNIVMYGAYWCPNCQRQREDMGNSFKKVSYIECALPGGQRGQTAQCDAAEIEAYPTWIFGDGSRLVGYQSLRTLSQRSGCELDGSRAQIPPESETGSSTTTTQAQIDQTNATPVQN